MIIAVTGAIGAGKSTALARLNLLLRARGLSTGGIISLRRENGDNRLGYDLWVLDNNDKQPLATRADLLGPEEEADCVPFFCFRFHKRALQDGEAAVMEGLGADVLFLDEVGLWELEGGGWSKCLRLLPRRAWAAILGLREGIEPDLQQRFGIYLDHIVGVRPGESDTAAEEVLRLLNM